MYLLAVLMAATMPFTAMAQDDDLYFNPKKEAKKQAEHRAQLQRAYAEQKARRDSIYALYWSGSNRNVDEYNRGGRFLSHYENVGKDSLGNDIIQFHVGKGVAPDSIYDDAYFAQKYADPEEDFSRTREMSRWDGYYDPWFYDYYGYGPYYWRSRMWGWRNPWRYGYYAGWYDPWYYGWGRPYWGPTVVYHPVNRGGITGSSNHGWVGRGGTPNVSGYRGSNSTSRRNTDAYNRQNSNSNFSGYRGSRDNNFNNRDNFNRDNNLRRNDDFNRNVYRNESNFNSGSFNRSNSSSFGGGNFGGGSRSGGFSGGGGRSGGGGHFGGRR